MDFTKKFEDTVLDVSLGDVSGGLEGGKADEEGLFFNKRCKRRKDVQVWSFQYRKLARKYTRCNRGFQ